MDVATRKALEHLRKHSEKSRKNIEQLEKSEHEHNIKIDESPGVRPDDKEGAWNGKSTGSTISWPAKKHNGWSAISVLAHELQHAADVDSGEFGELTGDDNENGYPDFEDKAVDTANEYRENMQENKRDDYGDENPDPEKRTAPEPGEPCKTKVAKND